MSLFEDETGIKLIIIIIIINGVIRTNFTLKSNFIFVRKYVLKVYNIKNNYRLCKVGHWSLCNV